MWDTLGGDTGHLSTCLHIPVGACPGGVAPSMLSLPSQVAAAGPSEGPWVHGRLSFSTEESGCQAAWALAPSSVGPGARLWLWLVPRWGLGCP